MVSDTDNSVSTFDEIIKETKTVLINFKEKNITLKTQNFYILLAFFLISIALLIAVSIYHYLIKFKQNKSIYYHFMSQLLN